jgi:hypothetical protein
VECRRGLASTPNSHNKDRKMDARDLDEMIHETVSEVLRSSGFSGKTSGQVVLRDRTTVMLGLVEDAVERYDGAAGYETKIIPICNLLYSEAAAKGPLELQITDVGSPHTGSLCKSLPPDLREKLKPIESSLRERHMKQYEGASTSGSQQQYLQKYFAPFVKRLMNLVVHAGEHPDGSTDDVFSRDSVRGDECWTFAGNDADMSEGCFVDSNVSSTSAASVESIVSVPDAGALELGDVLTKAKVAELFDNYYQCQSEEGRAVVAEQLSACGYQVSSGGTGTR